MANNVLTVQNREEFRAWLAANGESETECFVALKRGKPTDTHTFWYLDAVEEALCFGWIDSTLALVEGKRMQRFTKRAKKSNWSELNKERVRRLERLGKMTDAGRAVLPDMAFRMDPALEADIREAGLWEIFIAMPPLYVRVRAYNLAFAKRQSSAAYAKAFSHFAAQTAAGKLYGIWNDYGRLP